MREYKNILIVNPFAVGDILSSTPLIRALRENFPDSYIAYICNQRVKSILTHNPHLNELFVFEISEYRNLWKVSKIKCITQFLKFLKVIKKRNFDLVIDLSLGDRYSFFLKILGIPIRAGFNYKNRGRFQTYKLDIKGFDDKHVVEYYFDLLKIVSIGGSPGELEVFLDKADKSWAENFLREHNINNKDLLIGVDPAGGESFGKWAYMKRWPIGHFAKACDRLSNELGAKVIILAGPKEKETVASLLSSMKNKPIDASNTSLMQLAAIIEKCNLIICNDTGPMRFANAFGKKTLAFFGPTDDKVYGPYPYDSNKHIVMKKDLPCKPCYQKFKLPDCQYNIKCLQDITVQDVLEAAKKLLSN